MSAPRSDLSAATTDELVAGIRAASRRFVIHMHIVFALQTIVYCAGFYLIFRACTE
jgi:hypothetical protein